VDFWEIGIGSELPAGVLLHRVASATPLNVAGPAMAGAVIAAHPGHPLSTAVGQGFLHGHHVGLFGMGFPLAHHDVSTATSAGADALLLCGRAASSMPPRSVGQGCEAEGMR
jgi:hypothetical protein